MLIAEIVSAAGSRSVPHRREVWFPKTDTHAAGRSLEQSVVSRTYLVPGNGLSLAPSQAMLTLLRDLRYSSRTLRKAPGFAIVAVLVLALGIGANTAIFSVVNSVLLRPLPYPGADRLAFIWETDLKDGIQREGPSAPNFLDWKEQSQSFEDMALLEAGTRTLPGEGEPGQVVGLPVTTNRARGPACGTHVGRWHTLPGHPCSGPLSRRSPAAKPPHLRARSASLWIAQ